MAIFPARRIGILPRKRARPARGTAAAVASAGAGWAEYGIFTFGPNFAQALARVEVEEIAGSPTKRQLGAIPNRSELSFLEGGRFDASGCRLSAVNAAAGGFDLAQLARRSVHAKWASAERF
jgi:hypothetical protein